MADNYEEKRDKTLKRIIAQVQLHHSASVTNAINKVFSDGENQANVESIAAAITESGEYIKTPFANDYFISKNPNWDLQRATVNNLKFQKQFGERTLLLGIITSAFIVLTYLQQCSDKSSEELKGIKQQLDSVRLSLDNIRGALKEKELKVSLEISDTTKR